MHPDAPGRPLNVMIVEDSVEDAERAVLELRRAGYAPDYRRVATTREMSAALDERLWDLVLCAHSLSDFTYEGALALVREKRIPAPVLLVSVAVVDEAAVFRGEGGRARHHHEGPPVAPGARGGTRTGGGPQPHPAACP